jgi:NADH-quinone oxidoreductase subunit J
MAEVIFYIFSVLLIFSAIMVISLKNPVQSVLFLIFAFFNAAGLFILLGAEFIAMTLIIVYVGAVAVLFLFVVMMLNINIAQLKQGFLRNLPLGIAIGGVIFTLIFLSIAPAQSFIPNPINTIPSDLTNTEALGMVLYTYYFFAFEAAGVILLIAMIGAIILTLTHSKNAKRQSVYTQVKRSKEDSVELLDIKPGRGLKI